MQYNFVIIRTDKGGRYARKILRSIEWLNENKYPQHEFITANYTIDEFLEMVDRSSLFILKYPVESTIIHARCANPRTNWTIRLRELEEKGYKVVNSVDTIELTSNKLACSLHLQGKVNHPKSWEYKKDTPLREIRILRDDIFNQLGEPQYIIAKPITSLEQGANVRKIRFQHWSDLLKEELDKVPGNKIVIQEYIPYTALHRVIVIGGKALPYTFIDKPEWHENDWKVSCCLNRTTMQIDEYPSPQILELAEQTQKEVGGVINFIDIFEYQAGIDNRSANVISGFTNAEINTACSLNIHENLAKLAGRNDWNIHYRIARQLVKELLNA